MYILKPNERTMPVMVYTQDTLVRGEVIVPDSVQRVNIWLRMDGAPHYMHILKPQVIVFGGSPLKPLSYSELFFPTTQVIAFHTIPPTDEPVDFDLTETDRMMQTVDLLVGTFVMRGSTRISTHTELATSIEMTRVAWMSLYDVEISNPYLPQMPVLQVPMVLVNSSHAAIGLES
ncbi:MAG TPA: hypothetical protein VFQ23_02855 [Anaerolineales bacterium]|nr:hypothetical protein [Anaerolineales bacterium]